MEIRYPDYYGKFQCIAGDCPDTCCAGWEIPVDRDSEAYYRRVQKQASASGDPDRKKFAEKLKKHIVGGRIVGNGNKCPFLDKDGLCWIHKELGPFALCKTCARHPRHMEDYGDLHELVLLLSCPEAARLILWENDGGYYVKSVSERQGNMDGIDRELLSLLLQVRDRIWRIGRDRNDSLDRRMALMLSMCHDIQGCLNKDDLKRAGEILKRRGTVRISGEPDARFLFMSDLMERLAETDVICSPFMERLEACRKLLYHSGDSRGRYEEDRKRFMKEEPQIKADWENLLGYFVYSFFLGALFDRDVLGKMKLALICTMAAEDLALAEWRFVGAVGQDAQIDICHGLARQVENCDENRAELEKAMGSRLFSSRRFLAALV